MMKKILITTTAMVITMMSAWAAQNNGQAAQPVITTSVDVLAFGDCYNGYREVRSLEVYGENLTENITLSLRGSRAIDFTISGSDVITPEMAEQGATVTVVSFPYYEGTYYDMYLIISYPGLSEIKVPITGRGIKTGARLYPDQSTLEFHTSVGCAVTMQVGVKKVNFDGWLAVPRIDEGDWFDPIDPVVLSFISGRIEGDDCFTLVPMSSLHSIDGRDSVVFKIKYHPLDMGPHSAQLIISTLSNDHPAHPVTVELTGDAVVLDYQPGDMDGDGQLSLSDVDDLIQQLANNASGLQDNPVADVNGDGQVNLQDIIDLIDLLLKGDTL